MASSVATQTKKKRNFSINGLKAIAIIAIIFYHLDVAWLPSGHLGVTIFLVLTGYFFTKSLVKEAKQEDQVRFTERIYKRIARLWPSVAILVIATALLCMMFNHVLLTKMKPDILPGLTFTLNIADVVRNVSYFDNFGGTSPLLHLWYLGVDIQFCILWPYVFYMLTENKERSNRKIRLFVFALAAVSALWMGYLYIPDTDPSRVYYSLDTRAFSPLIGAIVALYPYKSIKNFNDTFGWAAPASMVVLVLAMIFVPGDTWLYFRGGLFVASILSAVVIAGLITKNPFSLMMKNPLLAEIGAMSLSLYLWHFPIILLLQANTNTSGVFVKLLAIALTFVAGYINYRFVERGSLFNESRVLQGNKRTKTALISLFVCSIAIYFGARLIPNETLIPEEAIQQAQNMEDSESQSVAAISTDKYQEAQKVKMDLEKLPSGKICLVEDQYLANQGVKSPLMIGDSIATALPAEFQTYFPNGKLDAKISRRPEAMQELLNEYLKQGIVGDVVILQAFNNTTPSPQILDEMVQACEGREVYLVNIKVPESIEGNVNRNLNECANKYDNVHVIDWNSLCAPHVKEYLWGDLTHLRPEGAEPYVNLLANSIAYGFAQKGGYVLNNEQGDAYRQQLETVKSAQSEMTSILEAATKH